MVWLNVKTLTYEYNITILFIGEDRELMSLETRTENYARVGQKEVKSQGNRDRAWKQQSSCLNNRRPRGPLRRTKERH